MTFTSDSEITHIAHGVRDLTLPKRAWTHAAHFAAAVWYLLQADHDAFTEMPGLIRAYNAATGVPNTDHDGYHETITLASLRAAQDGLGRMCLGLPLHEKVNALLATDYGKPDWLLGYWSKEVLFSVAARRGWVDPDVQPLPFD